jgi:hypothetical protein
LGLQSNEKKEKGKKNLDSSFILDLAAPNARQKETYYSVKRDLL